MASEDQTHYEILRVPSDAGLGEIRTAYRRLARVYHPDAGGSEEDFKRINAAYEVLSQPHLRAQYDEWLRTGCPVAEPLAPEQPPAIRRIDLGAMVAVLMLLVALCHYGYVLIFSGMNVLERLASAVILPPLYCIAIGLVIYLFES